jgi:hypothetical protein
VSIAEDWQLLGLEPTDDRREIKRAYSRALKTFDPDADPGAFIRLRTAFENATEWGTQTPWWDEDFQDEEEENMPLPAAETAEEGEEEAADFSFPDVASSRPWFGWRPELTFGEGPLQELVESLDRLLFDEGADPAGVERLGRAILGSPELENVDRQTAVEEWMASAIMAAIPASDPLIEPAIKRFGWASPRPLSAVNPSVDAVLERAEDRRRLAEIGHREHRHHAALAELQGAPRQRLGIFRLPLAGSVSDFLTFVRSSHPTLELDLNQESVEWWDRYLAGRRLPSSFWLLMLCGPPMLIFAATLGIRIATGEDPNFLGISLAAVPVMLALILAGSELRYRAAGLREVRELKGVSAPLLRAAAILALALPFLFASLPAGLMAVVLSWVTCAAVGMIAHRHIWPPLWEESGEKWRRWFFPIVAALVSICVLAEIDPGLVLQLAAPLALLCWLGGRGVADIGGEIGNSSRATHVAFWAAALLLWLVGAAALARGFSWDVPAPFVAAVPVALIAQYWTTYAKPIFLPWLEWPLRLVIVIVYIRGSAALDADDVGLGSLSIAVMAYGLIFSLARLLAGFPKNRRDYE